MLCKLIFVASLAVGVFGRTVFNAQYEPDHLYDEYSQNIATEYCKAAKAEDKVPQVKASIKTFVTCVADVIDTEAIIMDIHEATGSGAYDGVVKKYCAKSPQLKDCTRDLIKGVAPCLPPSEIRTSEKSTFALIDFLCDNNGARIISFVKEDGAQCIQQKQVELAFCQSEMQLNFTKLQYGNASTPPTSMLMVPKEEKCGIVDNTLSCLANALKGCSNKIPSNLAQELHDIYLNSMSCTGETYETKAEVLVGTINVAPQSLLPSSAGKDMYGLMKRKLELEVRTAELETWNRENELHVKHTILTSDIKNN